MVTLKKVHLAVGIFSLLIPPFVGILTGYIDLRTQFQSIRLEVERQYVRKDHLNPMQDKINQIAEDVAEIKGTIKGRGYRSQRLEIEPVLQATVDSKNPSHN